MDEILSMRRIVDGKEIVETCDGRLMSPDEYNKYMCESALAWTPPPVFSKEEEAFRRGYHHGFHTAKHNENITETDVRVWRHSGWEMTPPGMKSVVKNEMYIEKQE